MKIVQVFAAFAIIAANASAIAAPVVCSVNLKPGVTDVAVKSHHVVDVCLPAGEKIAELASGNAVEWLVTGNKEAGRMTVKVAAEAANETNLIVWSDTATRYEVRLTQSFAAADKSAKK